MKLPVGVQGFRIGGQGSPHLPVDVRPETPPLEGGGRWDSQKRAHGGRHVDQTGNRFYPLAGQPAVGEADDQGNVGGAAIEQETVIEFAVVAQPFTVVSGDNQEGMVRNAFVDQTLPKLLNQVIDVGQFTIVDPCGEARPPGCGQKKRAVQIIEMDKRKETACATVADPFGRSLLDAVTANLNRSGVCPGESIQGEISPIFVKSACQAKATIQNEAADEGGGLEPVGPHLLGYRGY